ncbi:mechanosensitive ion channel family protein [Halosegnis sp.]|uniref:mechanosensitive ion channel family protein n=1 Tax=Halosegnis sp. TaxID=2864959 RepID=UPI0035D4DAC8
MNLIQILGVVSDTAGRVATSALIIGGFLLLVAGLYRVGEPLKRHISEEAAEAIQAAAGVAAGVVAGGALVDLWNQAATVSEAWTQVRPGAGTLVRVLIALLAVGIIYTVTRVTKRFVRISERRDAISSHQREILHHVVQIALFVPALVFVLTLFDVPLGNLLLSASVIGVIVGLAARQTLGAVLAGFVLLFSRPFKLGDWVEIDDHEGIVTDVSIVNTELRTFDDERVMIPNDEVTSQPILNRTRSNRLRVQVDVGVDYGTDVSRAMEVAADAMADVEVVESQPAPDVVVESFGDSAVVLTLRFYVADPSIQRKWQAQNAVMEQVKAAFEAADITIPFPQRVLSGREATDGLAVRGADLASPPTPSGGLSTDGGDGDG